DAEDLPRLEIDPDADGELRVPLQPVLVVRHRGQPTFVVIAGADDYTQGVGRVVLLGIAVLLVAAACGGTATYSVDKSRSCLANEGAQIGGPLHFVATTA